MANTPIQTQQDPEPVSVLLNDAGLYEQLEAFVRRRVPSVFDAEDLVQQILVKILSRSVPEHGEFAPWLFTVARNAVIDASRQRAVQHRREQQPGRLAPATEELAGDVPSSTELPDSDYGSQEIANFLVRLLTELDERDQAALRAIDLQGESQRSYAEQAGLEYATLKSRVQRARKRLRRELERHCHVSLDGRGLPMSCRPKHRDCCSDKED